MLLLPVAVGLLTAGAALFAAGAAFVKLFGLGLDVDPFMLHLYAAFAEKERNVISERTKAALATLKAARRPLGSPLEVLIFFLYYSSTSSKRSKKQHTPKHTSTSEATRRVGKQRHSRSSHVYCREDQIWGIGCS
jgi:hypothetical protein